MHADIYTYINCRVKIERPMHACMDYIVHMHACTSCIAWAIIIIPCMHAVLLIIAHTSAIERTQLQEA